MTPSIESLIASGGEKGLADFAIHFYVGVTIVVMLGLVYMARRGFGDRVFKKPSAQCAEQLYLFIEKMALSIIGFFAGLAVVLVWTNRNQD